jgi:glyoxylase-like metal-dependent hydrolase (beta-lactamase superfamily II)
MNPVTSSISVLKHPFRVPVAPGIAIDRSVNSFLVFSETITLIDTGVSGCEKSIFNAIRSTGRDPSDIGLIVLTHSHPDHIGAARAIQQTTGCRIAAHPAERAWIEDVGLQNCERPVPGFETLVGGAVHVDDAVSDGDLIALHGKRAGTLRVIHTPGHSPGSISLFLQDNGTCFSGDAIPVPGDLPVYDDVLASVRSIRRLRELPRIRVLLPAWDEPVTVRDVYQRMDRALAYLQQIHEAVLANAHTGYQDMMELTRKTAATLGLPPRAVNPLLARTFAANLHIRDIQNLI